MKLSKKITVLLVSSLVLSSVFADEKGKEIMKRAEDKKSPSFTQSMVLMELKDKSGSTDTRQVVQYGKDDGKKTSVVMDFKGPSSVKDTIFSHFSHNFATFLSYSIHIISKKDNRLHAAINLLSGEENEK